MLIIFFGYQICIGSRTHHNRSLLVREAMETDLIYDRILV